MRERRAGLDRPPQRRRTRSRARGPRCSDTSLRTLAGTSGLVLLLALAGVGATSATLHDSGALTTSLTSGRFATESRTAGADWRHHREPPGAALTFGTAGMLPGQSRYASYAVRPSPDSTLQGDLRLDGINLSEPKLASALRYRIVTTPQWNPACGPAQLAGPGPFLAGGPSAYASVASLPEPTSLPLGRAPVHLCVEINLMANAAQSLEGTSTTVQLAFSSAITGDWGSSEHASGTVSTASLTPVTDLRCIGGTNRPALVTWRAPKGFEPTGYEWTLRGNSPKSGWNPPNETSVVVDSSWVFGGTHYYTFEVRAIGTATWSSQPATIQISFGFWGSSC